MNINYSLLDQLKRYFQGELDPAEAETISKKLEQDPVYQAHAYVYKISQEGLSGHDRQKQLKNIKDFSAAIDIEAIWEQDRKLTQQKRWILGLLAIFLAIMASLLVVRNLPEKPQKQVPIANQEEEAEVLFGADGQEQVVSITPFKWNATQQLIPLSKAQRHLVLHLRQQAGISFLRKGDTLHLYTPNLNYDPIQWIDIEQENTGVLLRLGNQLFELPKQQAEGKLKASTLTVQDLPQ